MAEEASDSKMLTAYTELARRIWEDEDYRDRALSEPRGALAENGWDVPEGTAVQIELVEPSEEASEKFKGEDIVAAWRQAVEAGELRILVPSEPQALEAEKLSDEELSGVAGGFYSYFYMTGCGAAETPAV